MRIFIAIDSSAHASVVVQTAAKLLRHVKQPLITLGTIIDASEAHATAERSPDVEIPRGTGWAGAGGFYVAQAPSARTVEDRAQAFARLRAEVDHSLHRLAGERLQGYDVQVYVEAGDDAGPAIARAAAAVEAELLILGTHGRTGLRRMVLGSVAQAAVHRSEVPAILVRELSPAAAAADEPLRALLPTDGSARVRAALPRVGALAGALGAEVTVLEVMELPNLVVQKTLDDQRRAVRRDVEEHVAALGAASVSAHGDVVEGFPARSIVNYARDHSFEIVLVPTHDRSEAGRVVFGSVADQLIHDLPCPVGLVRARRA